MERAEMLELWSDMWKEGNWVPSWPDSLAGLSAEQARWIPGAGVHSIWQEVTHVIFWRRVTLDLMAGGTAPDAEVVERLEFAAPEEQTDDTWADTVAALKETQ